MMWEDTERDKGQEGRSWTETRCTRIGCGNPEEAADLSEGMPDGFQQQLRPEGKCSANHTSYHRLATE